MTADEKRQLVLAKYKSILGRNGYNQTLRDYCFKRYKDGKYYSDCSSSISYCYKEAGFGFGILNTVGMYQCEKFTTVDVSIVDGQIKESDIAKLRVGDMLLFAGSDVSRKYANYVGHVEMVAVVGENAKTTTIYGHGSNTPSIKNLYNYCKTRKNSKTNTKIKDKRLIKVVRFIQDDDNDMSEFQYTTFVKSIQSAIGAKIDGIVEKETLSKLPTISKHKNNKHKCVKAIQTYLSYLGYNVGKIDGIAGELFHNAVKKYQSDSKLDIIDGELTGSENGKLGDTWKTILKNQ